MRGAFASLQTVPVIVSSDLFVSNVPVDVTMSYEKGAEVLLPTNLTLECNEQLN